MLPVDLLQLLKRAAPYAGAVFLGLALYLVASTANAFLAHALHVVPRVEDLPPPPSPARRHEGPRPLDLRPVVERNLLGAKREDLSPKASEEVVEAPASVAGRDFQESELRPCTLNIAVRATLVAEGAPAWSIAVVYDNQRRENRVVSSVEGRNAIGDDAAVVEIRSREIVVRRRDHFERCKAEESASSSRPHVTSSRPSSSSHSTSGKGVTRISETEYTIEKAEVDNALSNLNRVATQARIVPSFRNGKANGFKLFSIKPGSIYAKIGLRNGDVIQKINGYELNSPDKALEIYQKLRDSTSVTIDLLRRGKTMTINYSIVP